MTLSVDSPATGTPARPSLAFCRLHITGEMSTDTIFPFVPSRRRR